MIELKVPTLGESVTEATVATWFKKPGDTCPPKEERTLKDIFCKEAK